VWIDPEQRLFVVILANRTFGPKAKHPADVMADIRNDIADVASLAVAEGESEQLSRVTFRSDTARTWNRSGRPAWRTVAEKSAQVNASKAPAKRAPAPFPLTVSPPPASPQAPVPDSARQAARSR
jgi:hypothetical protein